MDFSKDLKGALNRAAEILQKGGVVIFPTDTVYGFLADAGNKKAIEKIFKIKKRPSEKPLAVFVKDFNMAKELAEISAEQERILKKHWPGKYTFVLKRRTPSSDESQTIALRIPRYKPLNDLLKKINRPLAQTSVNISGQKPLVKIKDIKQLIKNRLSLGPEQVLIIDAGNLPKSKPSAIIDLTGNKIKFLRK